MTRDTRRRKVLITGASGGMGRACARSFGGTMDLVLTDVATDSLSAFSAELLREGYTIAASLAGDLNDESLIARLVESVDEGEGLGTLVHTAAVSTVQADWQTIMKVNFIATARIVRSIEPILRHDSVAILMASSAGHLMPASNEADKILSDPFNPDFLAMIKPIVTTMAEDGSEMALSAVSYGLSKRAIIAMCRARVSTWSAQGARIVSISPGLTLTPLGEREMAENPHMPAVLTAVPLGRWGTVMDVAAAAAFLASREARYITGCDLQIDGGLVAQLSQTV